MTFKLHLNYTAIMKDTIKKTRNRKSGLKSEKVDETKKRTFLQVGRDEELNNRLDRLKVLTGLITESEITRLALLELENKYNQQ